MNVYIVLHHELFEYPDGGLHADEMAFHVASSLKKALNYIKTHQVAEWSWWEIQRQKLDGQDWPTHVGYYGRKGGKLRCGHDGRKKAEAAYKSKHKEIPMQG